MAQATSVRVRYNNLCLDTPALKRTKRFPLLVSSKKPNLIKDVAFDSGLALDDDSSPHHCVGFLFFAWIPPHRVRVRVRPVPTSSHNTHHCPTSHISLITPQLITAPLLTPHLSHLSSHHNSSQLHISRLTYHISHHTGPGPRLAFVWEAQYTAPSGGAGARVGAAGPWLAFVWQAQYTESLLEELVRAWAGPRLACVWQAQYTEPSGGAPLTRGSLSCGRRSAAARVGAAGRWLASMWQCTEPFAGAGARVGAAGMWLPFVWQTQYSETSGAGARVGATGPQLAFVWQAQYTEPSGEAGARVGAAGPRLAFVWQAKYTAPSEAGARVGDAGARLAFVWQAQYTAPSGGAGARVGAAGPWLAFVWQAQYTESLLEELVRAWAPLARGWLSCGRRSTQSLLEELVCASAGFRVAGAIHRAFWSWCARGRRWPAAGFRVAEAVYTAVGGGAAARVGVTGPRLAFVWQAQYSVPSGGAAARVGAAGARLALCGADGLSWERCSTQCLLEELVRTWAPLARGWLFVGQTGFGGKGVVHRAFWRSSGLPPTPSFTPTIFNTPSFTPSLTHHLSHTTLSHTPLCHTPSFTPLCHTLSFRHNFVTHHLSHTIFHTQLCHPLFHTQLSHTIFHTQLCHTPSLTHQFVTHTPSFTHTHLCHIALSHTIFHTSSFTPLCQTPSFTHHL